MKNVTVKKARRKSKKQNEEGSWYLTQSMCHTEHSDTGTAKPNRHPGDVWNRYGRNSVGLASMRHGKRKP